MPVSTDVIYTAVAIYKEARGEPQRCQKLVAEVIRNRMDDRGKTAREVVREKGQFSWVRLTRKNNVLTEYLRVQIKASKSDGEKQALDRSIRIATTVLQPAYNPNHNYQFFNSLNGGRYDTRCGNLKFSSNYRGHYRK